MKLYLSTLILFLLVNILFINSLKTNLQIQLQKFKHIKKVIQTTINSMKLGNYLRMLMLKNNNLLDDEFYFLNDEDFPKLTPGLINFQTVESSDEKNEFKARLFALKYANARKANEKLKPLSVTDESKKLQHAEWKNYVVLMVGGNGQTKLTRVCFPNDLKENFAVITDYENDCNTKINKITKLRILDENSEGGKKFNRSHRRHKKVHTKKK